MLNCYLLCDSLTVRMVSLARLEQVVFATVTFRCRHFSQDGATIEDLLLRDTTGRRD